MEIPKDAKIMIPIREQTAIGQYNDALYYTQSELTAAKEAEVLAAKTKRVNDWIAFVTAQSSKPPYVPTKEELKEQSAMQADQIAVITDQLIAASPTKAEAQAIIDKLTASVTKLQAVTAEVAPKDAEDVKL